MASLTVAVPQVASIFYISREYTGSAVLERRKRFRHRTYLGALVSLGSKLGSMDCLVRNLSDDGAMIEFDERRILPQRFELRIRNRQERFRAVIIWRETQKAGVLFSR